MKAAQISETLDPKALSCAALRWFAFTASVGWIHVFKKGECFRDVEGDFYGPYCVARCIRELAYKPIINSERSETEGYSRIDYRSCLAIELPVDECKIHIWIVTT